MFKNDDNALPNPANPPLKLRRWSDTDNNPCKQEADASYQCLHDNNFDRMKCQGAFVNYRNCQKFWKKIQKDRRQQGISPALPPEDERQEMIQKMQPKSS